MMIYSDELNTQYMFINWPVPIYTPKQRDKVELKGYCHRDSKILVKAATIFLTKNLFTKIKLLLEY